MELAIVGLIRKTTFNAAHLPGDIDGASHIYILNKLTLYICAIWDGQRTEASLCFDSL